MKGAHEQTSHVRKALGSQLAGKKAECQHLLLRGKAEAELSVRKCYSLILSLWLPASH